MPTPPGLCRLIDFCLKWMNMANATKFISGQVDAYAESWQGDHQQAVEFWELEERIGVALALYHYIHSLDVRWSDQVRAGRAAVDDLESQSILTLYRRWLGPAEQVLASVKGLESQGFSVNGAQEFRDSWHRVRTATCDAAALQASFDELDAGKGIPLGEVVDELRRHHVAAGKS